LHKYVTNSTHQASTTETYQLNRNVHSRHVNIISMQHVKAAAAASYSC